MDSFFKNYQKAADIIEKISIATTALFLFALLGINVYSIIADLCLPWSAPWLEELSALFFSWATFIAAGVIVRYGGHVGVDMLTSRFKGKIHLAFRIFSFACICWVSFVMIKYGIITVQTARQTSVYLDISLKWFYAPIPISGVLFIFFALAALLPYARKDEDFELNVNPEVM